MVRLFVPTGEGQHDINPRPLEPLPANYVLSQSCLSSCFYACIATSALSLIGRCHPGTFLKWTAYINTVLLARSAYYEYSFVAVNKQLLKRDGIEPTPYKLWERNENWTIDDVMLAGGSLGLLAALRKNLFPGVSGWRRYLGAVTTAVGASYYGGTFLWSSRERFQIAQVFLQQHGRRSDNIQYTLAQDDDFKRSLPRLARWCLIWRHGARRGPETTNQQNNSSTATHGVVVPFNETEVEGPDLHYGMRAYHQNPSATGVPKLAAQIDYFDKMRLQHAFELEHVWRELAAKEHLLYQLPAEEDATDILRREAQLLHSIAQTLWLQKALFDFLVADVRKQHSQLTHKDSGELGAWEPAELEDFGHDPEWRQQYSPHISVAAIRDRWDQQRKDLALLEQVMESPNAPPLPNPDMVDQVRKNVEATGRLLKEFESQVEKAEQARQKFELSNPSKPA